MIHTDYYTLAPLEVVKGNKSNVVTMKEEEIVPAGEEKDVVVDYGDGYLAKAQTLEKKKVRVAAEALHPIRDFRFNKNVEYKGIGNSCLMRVNACASLRLNMFLLNPLKTSTLDKTIRYFAGIFLKPIAATFDAFLNIVFLVMKIAMLFLIIPVVKLFQKIAKPKEKVEFKLTMDYAVGNVKAQADSFGYSFFYFIYQVLAFWSFNFLGPKNDFILRTSALFSWNYNVIETTRDKLNIVTSAVYKFILDVNRVEYIREKCGWAIVSDEVFETLYNPWGKNIVSHIHHDYTENSILDLRNLERQEIKVK
jgi:hypothetical protein